MRISVTVLLLGTACSSGFESGKYRANYDETMYGSGTLYLRSDSEANIISASFESTGL